MKKRSNKFFVLATSFTAIIIVLAMCLIYLMLNDEHNNENPKGHQAGQIKHVESLAEPHNQQVQIIATDPQHKSLRLSMVGDVLIHDSVLRAARASRDEQSDFSFIFQNIKDCYTHFDLNIINMEGTLGPAPFSAYPLFKSPTRLAHDMKNAGINMAITANNHALDSYGDGIKSTYEALINQQILPVGTAINQNPTWKIVDINGIKIGFAAYTYETIHQGQSRAINGIPIPKEVENQIDTFSYEPDIMERDMDEMKARVAEMKAEGAEFIIFSMHWGTEYNWQVDDYQKAYAQNLAAAGVDLILGSGPHVVQPITSIYIPDTKHSCLVYNSVGNFASAQFFDTGNSQGHAEDGIMALVEIEQINGKTTIKRAGYTPLYCYKPLKYTGTASTAVIHALARNNPAIVDNHLDLIEASADRIRQIMYQNQTPEFAIQEYPLGFFDEN